MAVKAILGRKIGMTQIFDEDGELIPVSVIDVSPMQFCKLRPKNMMAMMQFN